MGALRRGRGAVSATLRYYSSRRRQSDIASLGGLLARPIHFRYSAGSAMLVGRGRDCCARYGDRVYAVARGKHNTQRLGKIFGGNRLDADSPPSYVLRHLTIRYVLRVTSLRRASHQRHSTTADQADVADHLV